MEKKNIPLYKINVEPFTVHDSTNIYDDDNIPDVDLPKTTDIVPEHIPSRDGLDDE